MSARDTHRIGDHTLPTIGDLPIAANVVIDQGNMVFRDGNGRATPWAADPALVAVGLATTKVDNTGGAAGAKRVPYRLGCFKLDVLGGDPITDANTKPGAPVFASDGTTVRRTSNSNAVPAAGIFAGMDVDGSGQAMVIVAAAVTASALAGSTAAAAQTAAQARRKLITIPVILSKSANAAVLARFKSPMAGTITGSALQVVDPATTAAKLGDVDLSIAGAPITGGKIQATSANMTPLGARVAGAAITAANTVAVGDEITAVWSNVTAFVEGEAVLQVEITPAAPAAL